MTNENILLKSELVTLKESNTILNKKLQKVEEDVVNLQQYVRRNNIEIHGIPDDINDDELEDKVRDW